MRHEASLLAPIAVAVAYEAGAAVFRSRGGGISVALAQVGALLLRARARRFLRAARAARERRAPAPRARRDRALLLARTARLAASPPCSARSRSSTRVRALHARAARYALVRTGEWRATSRRRCLVADRLALLWLRPLVERDALAQSRATASGCADSQQYADQLVDLGAAPLPARARGARAERRRAVAALFLAAARGARVRRRWARTCSAGRCSILAPDGGAVALRALLGRGRRSRRRAARPGSRRCRSRSRVGSRSPRAAWSCSAGRARGGDRAPARSGPATSATACAHGGPALATWVALVGGAARARRGAAVRPRDRARAPPLGRGRRGAVRAAGRRARLLALGPAATRPTRGALAAARPQPAHEGAEGRGRDRAGRGRATRSPPPRRSTSSPRPSRTSRTRTRTTRTARRRRPALARDATTRRSPRRYGATWAIRAGRLYRLPQ